MVREYLMGSVVQSKKTFNIEDGGHMVTQQCECTE